MNKIDWIQGDNHALEFPAHAGALISGGADFLTRAFRASGILSDGNQVVEILEAKEIFGGSTGRKMLLNVTYDNPENLYTRLFVKFSRDFDDARRDAARVQMEREVCFALLSQRPNFPITVPACYFADFHGQSGTGILITQCIPFGENGIEPQYEKGLDHTMPDVFGHYRALIQALAKLAGSHKAGRFEAAVDRYFPFDPEKLTVSAREPYTPHQIAMRVEALADFMDQNPLLFPDHLRSPTFFARLREEAPRFQKVSAKVNTVLQSRPEMVALCHWNAHVDNAWFWRESGELICGLMDWGNVSQMNVAVALWGCLSAAELSLWNNHLDDLLDEFIIVFKQYGGAHLEKAEVLRHLQLNVAMMGLAWMLDSPRSMLIAEPDLTQARGTYDDKIVGNERVRSQLLILKVFLDLWARSDMKALIRDLEKL